MSHFTVIVFGENYEEQLAPFHEFECTGFNDQYVQDVDITEKAREKYNSSTSLHYRSPTGEHFSAYDDQFYREPTPEETAKIGVVAGTGCSGGISFTSRDWKDGRGYRTKIHFLPSGWTEVRMNDNELQSFAEFVKDYYGISPVFEDMSPDIGPVGEDKSGFKHKHKYGYAVVNEFGEVLKVVNRTNPNAQWDWYVVGGRWSGYFKTKANTTNATLGEQTFGFYEPEPVKPGYADSLLKKDIDIEGMRKEAADSARTKYRKVRAVTGPENWISWEAMSDEKSTHFVKDIDARREVYNNQPAIVRLSESKDDDIRWLWSKDEYLVSEEKYVKDAEDSALSSFAVIKDGKWYQRGEMGWWACVSDEKDKEVWNEEFSKLFESMPEDTLVTVIDCHI